MLLSLVIPVVSSAQSADVDTSGDASCAIISINLRYSSRDSSTGGAVSVLQDFLNSHGYLSSQPTGFFGSMTRSAVIAFQNANGISATPPGFVGSQTRAKIQDIDCNPQSGQPTTYIQPTISPSNNGSNSSALQAQINSLLETIKSLQGQLSNTTPTSPVMCTQMGVMCKEGYVATGPCKQQCVPISSPGSSVPSSPGIPASGSISVITPNGGESWAKWTTQTIKWQDSSNVRPYDIKLISYVPSCTGTVCPTQYAYRAPYVVVKNIDALSYNWTITNCGVGNECSSNFEIPEGLYQIQICKSGLDICDSSDGYFKITSTNNTTIHYDVNGDGQVNVADQQVLYNAVMGVGVSCGAGCDLNGDGQINVADLQLMTNYFNGKAAQ